MQPLAFGSPRATTCPHTTSLLFRSSPNKTMAPMAGCSCTRHNNSTNRLEAGGGFAPFFRMTTGAKAEIEAIGIQPKNQAEPALAPSILISPFAGNDVPFFASDGAAWNNTLRLGAVSVTERACLRNSPPSTGDCVERNGQGR